MTQPDIERKLSQMREIVRSLKSVVVAFSAGVDSTFVLKVALDELGSDNVLAVTSNSDSLAQSEFEDAVRLAQQTGAEHVVIQTDEFENPNYLANPTNRCYHCKTALYDHLDALIKERGLCAVVNGANVDDFGDFRPGLQAASEHEVRAPAAEAGLTKNDIRVLSQRMGLPTFDKPASPCLSSRVQYGEEISPEKLRRIESCEAYLHQLGFRECRVRHHNRLARIEVPADRIEELSHPGTRVEIAAHFRAAGYQYVTIDLQGFRSGSMNEVISIGLPKSTH